MSDDHPVGDVKISLTADCPRCGRREEFDAEPEARAWLTGHIQHAHGDVLPAFETTDE